MPKKIFCEMCRIDVEHVVTIKEMTGTIKNKKYHYIGEEALCKYCGSIVFIPEIIDSNLKSLYDVFRKENDLVSLDEIHAIPEKYNIEKRSISILFGWDELTFSRYCEGDISKKQYSDMFRRIYHDPLYYSELLEANKENLKSRNDYE